MSLSIQTSYASLVTQNSLSSANDKLTTAMECIRYGLNSGETLGYVGGKI